MALGTFVVASFTLDLENLVIWLVIGLIAGFLASKLVRGRGLGLIGDIVVGLLGALIGGFLVDFFGINFSFLNSRITTAIIAFLGACLLLLIIRAVRGDRKRR